MEEDRKWEGTTILDRVARTVREEDSGRCVHTYTCSPAHEYICAWSGKAMKVRLPDEIQMPNSV